MRSPRSSYRAPSRWLTLTNAVLISLAAAFVMAWLQVPLDVWLRFDSKTFFARPWAALTYPWGSTGDGRGLIFELLLFLWLYQLGNALEREVSKGTWVAVFLAGTLAPALCLLAAPQPVVLIGAYVPVAALALYWCGRSPHDVLSFWGLPLARKWLALIILLLVVFSIGTGVPVAGLIAGIPLALFYVAGTRRWSLEPRRRKESRKEQAEFNQFIDDVRDRERERDERERLRKLFESSLQDDDPRSGSDDR